MKFTAGLPRVAYARLVILMLCLVPGSAPKRSAARALCRPKELTVLTKAEVKETLQRFDKDNGGNLGIWHPGFPLLQVNHNSTLHGPKVLCSLHFMAQGLEEIKKDQKTDLNPTDVVLNNLFKETIARVKMLAECVKSVLEGECANKPSPPNMPKHTFEKKQWSHTLLKSAMDYLAWMERRLPIQNTRPNVKGTQKTKPAAKERHSFFSGSGHPL